MGHIKHHAITVTTFDEKEIQIAHRFAKSLFGDQVTEVIKSPINAWFSFLIGPDGSKEGWGDSEVGDKNRDQFRTFVESQNDPDDGSNSLKYIEYFYGEDEGKAAIENHN